MGRIVRSAVIVQATVLGLLAFLSLFQPSTVACDEFAGSCFENDPDNEYSGAVGCSVHLVNRHLEAWATCDIGFSPLALNYVAAEDAPELSPEAFIEFTVTIQRTGATGTDEPWGFRLQEGVPGVIIDGSAYQSGTLLSSETSTSFTLNLSADPSAGVDEAVIGVAFWDSEHKVLYDRIAFTVDDGEPIIPLWAVAWSALFVALIALLLAFLAWRHPKP